MLHTSSTGDRKSDADVIRDMASKSLRQALAEVHSDPGLLNEAQG